MLTWNKTIPHLVPKQLQIWERDGGYQASDDSFVIVDGELSDSFIDSTLASAHHYLNNQEEMNMEITQFTTQHPPVYSDGMKISIGLKEKDRQTMADELSIVLADTYALYLKTQNFHWNVSGSKFVSLHQLFGTQYQQLAEAVDLIAERIRALGFWAPGSFSQFMKMTSIPDGLEADDADEMIQSLIEGHESVARTLHSVVQLSEQVHDGPTLDLTTHRMAEHEKNAWMLRSLMA